MSSPVFFANKNKAEGEKIKIRTIKGPSYLPPHRYHDLIPCMSCNSKSGAELAGEQL